MRHAVTTPAYLFRKALDNVLYALTAEQQSVTLSSTDDDPFPTRAPRGWLPLYTMVTFRPDISYAAVKRKVQRQTDILNYTIWISAAATVGVIGFTCVRIWRAVRRG
jgi:kynurenine 3-monooxygenase